MGMQIMAIFQNGLFIGCREGSRLLLDIHAANSFTTVYFKLLAFLF